MSVEIYESLVPGPLQSNYNGDTLYWNFIIMSLAFSANHGSVVACLAYSSSQLGDHLGGYGSGTLYVCYAITAFLFSKPIIAMVGPKNGLLLGVGGYCLYVIGFLLAVLIEDTEMRWGIFIATCIIGGTAGGLLWTAQGRYFAKNALLYAEHCDLTPEEANASFAGIFATCYLGLEMLTKVLATVIFVSSEDEAPSIVFSMYTVIAFCAVYFVSRLEHLDEDGTWAFDVEAVSRNTAGTGLLLVTDARLALLVPFQLAFGFASSFVPYYVFGTVVGDSDELGGKYIGLLSATIALTGALTAIPAGWVANAFGKSYLMTTGGLCLTVAGGAFLLYDNDQLGTWGMIFPYLIIYGIGRGTWENTNKAIVADFFSASPDICTSAFACISFSSGISGAIGYFIWPNTNTDTIAYIVSLTSLVAILTYFLALSIHRSRLAQAYSTISSK